MTTTRDPIDQGVPSTGGDWFASVAGIEPGTKLFDIRSERPLIERYLQGSFDALFEPDDDRGLSAAERVAVALRVAAAHDDEVLVGAYRDRLATLTDHTKVVAIERYPIATAGSARLHALLRHADLLAATPRETSAQSIDDLRAGGLTESQIVTTTLLIGFVSYQARALAGLRALEGAL